MAWKPEYGVHLWNELCEDWNGVIDKSMAPWSKGVASEMVFWRESHLDFDILDDLYPDQLASYKLHWEVGQKKGAAIIYFHGVAKPNNSHQDIKRYWQ